MPSKHKKEKKTEEHENESERQQRGEEEQSQSSQKTKKKKSSEKKDRAPAKKDTSRYAENPIDGITKPAIKRLSRRSGVKRITLRSVPHFRIIMDKFISELCKHAIASMESGGKNRKTIIPRDIILACKNLGITLLGYN